MQVAGRQIEKILTGLAGEYHVAAELCRRGFFASLPLKNYPKVDIFVMHPIEQYAVPIQVKTVARGEGKWGFFVPKDATSYQGLFVFVLLGDDEHPYETFILTPEQVQERAGRARHDFMTARPHPDGMKEEDQLFMLRESQIDDRREAWDIVTKRLRAERFVWHEGEVEFLRRDDATEKDDE